MTWVRIPSGGFKLLHKVRFISEDSIKVDGYVAFLPRDGESVMIPDMDEPVVVSDILHNVFVNPELDHNHHSIVAEIYWLDASTYRKLQKSNL